MFCIIRSSQEGVSTVFHQIAPGHEVHSREVGDAVFIQCGWNRYPDSFNSVAVSLEITCASRVGLEQRSSASMPTERECAEVQCLVVISLPPIGHPVAQSELSF
jgi:hypothetical protein